jgi:hypothetical protein
LDPITCKACGEPKSRDEFYRHAKKRSGRQSWCKQCCADYNHAMYRTTHPVEKRARSWRRQATP